MQFKGDGTGPSGLSQATLGNSATSESETLARATMTTASTTSSGAAMSPSASGPEDGQSDSGKDSKASAIKRPMNSFMVFSQEYRPRLKQQFPNKYASSWHCFCSLARSMISCFGSVFRTGPFHYILRDNKAISKLLGEKWLSMAPDARAPYVKEANRLAEKHKQEHPGWKFKRQVRLCLRAAVDVCRLCRVRREWATTG
jgi:hypothetical protein